MVVEVASTKFFTFFGMDQDFHPIYLTKTGSDKMTEYVDFEIVSTENSQITLKGYVNITTIDDDEPEIGYYDHQGFTTTNLPKNPFDFAEEENMQYYKLIQNWAEDSQFLQWIFDCKDDNRRAIDRGNYYLIIN